MYYIIDYKVVEVRFLTFHSMVVISLLSSSFSDLCSSTIAGFTGSFGESGIVHIHAVLSPELLLLFFI